MGGKKTPVVLWDKEDWGTITAATYINYVLQPVLWPFWYWERQAQGTPLLVMGGGAFESAHRANLTQQC